MNANQPAYLKVAFPKAIERNVYCLALLDILRYADVITSRTEDGEITIRPPKGVVNNQQWAERVLKYCNQLGLPALIYRPQEIAPPGSIIPCDNPSKHPNGCEHSIEKTTDTAPWAVDELRRRK